jgi:hypothetical protein
MVAYFPVPYVDELLYSVIARYGVHQDIQAGRELINDLFGSNNAAAVVDFPGHLQALCQHTNHLIRYSPNDWIQKHTLYPAYFLFLPDERRKQIIASAESEQAGNVHTRIGAAAFNVKLPRFLKICKECYQAQWQGFGEPYWQRSLQMPGVYLCPIHKNYLHETDIPYHPAGKFNFIPATKVKLTKQLSIDVSGDIKVKLTQLSQNISDLFEISFAETNLLAKWTGYYRQLASFNGYMHNTRVDHTRVRQQVESYWTPSLFMCLDIPLGNPSNWLVQLFRKHRKGIHYLCHLMVWQAFKKEPQEVFEEVARASVIDFQFLVKAQSITSDPKTLNSQRHKWKMLCRDNQDKGIKWLRTEGAAGATYTWLYRHDLNWLKSNSPKRTKIRESKHRIDWKQRDCDILGELHALESSGKLQNLRGRTSKTWISKQLSKQPLLEKHLNQLPMTMGYIERASEPIEEFQMRRIATIAAKLYANNELITDWLIFRKAGIRKKYQNPALKKYIDDIKNKLINGISINL